MTGAESMELFDAVSELAQTVDEVAGLEETVTRAEQIIARHTAALEVGIGLVPTWRGHSRELDTSRIPTTRHRLAQQAYESGMVHTSYRGRSDTPQVEFVAVPITRGSNRIGVLAAHYPEGMHVSVRTLRSAASQLALVFENAMLLADRPGSGEDWRAQAGGAMPIAPSTGTVIYGEPAAAGTASGRALRWEAGFDAFAELEASAVDADRIERLDGALRATEAQLEQIRRDAAEMVDPAAAAIFDAHLLMLRDRSFAGQIRERTQTGAAPEHAVRAVVEALIARLESLQNRRVSEKVQDLRDIGLRVLRNLTGSSDEIDASYGGRIVVARHMYPSELVSLAAQNIEGALFLGSGLTAHLSILARSLEIPALLTQDARILSIPSGTPLLLDTAASRVVIGPSQSDIARVAEPIPDLNRSALETLGRSNRERGVTIRANVNLLHDAQRGRDLGADGIGLYRSEFPFIIESGIVSEAEQYRIYASIAQTVGDQPLVMRTADIGGDKILPSAGESEANPFLGVRGIRFSLANRELFRDQLRAMLRAGSGSDLRIMFPMVSSIEEVLEARQEIEAAKSELEADAIEFHANPKLGAMIELPSAVEAASELARNTDFLSIGTNDLVMYLLAVDRTNARLSEMYRSFHPTVLGTLARIASTVAKHDCELSVCGDSAADPVMAAFLLGLGVRSFSVSPASVANARASLAVVSDQMAREVVDRLLALTRVRDMEQAVADVRRTIAAQRDQLLVQLRD